MANNVSLGKAYVVVGGNTAPLFKAMGRAEKRVARFGAKVGQFAKSFAALGTAILTPFLLATRVGLAFEKQMAEVAAVTGATSKQFQELEATARKLGETTSFTAEEAAGAMVQLGRAGFDTNEIIAAIPTTLNLARASGLGMAEVAEIVADVGRSFNIAATDIARVADAITFTANNATTNIQQVGEAIKFVAPAARATGQSLETITSALGILANQGIKGSEAGTALTAVLSNLIKTDVQDKMEDLGLKIKDTNGQMKSLDIVLEQLQSKLSKSDAVSRAAILFDLFQKRGFRAAETLSKFTDGWRTFRSETQAANGITKTTAEIMEGNLNKSLNLALSALNEIAISIKQAVTPALTELLNGLQGVFKDVSKFVRENQELVVTLGKVGVAALALAASFGTLAIATKALAFTMSASGGLASSIGVGINALKAFRTAAVIASVTSAGELIPAIGAMGTAFKGITIASIGAKVAFLKFSIVVAGPVIAAFAAAAAIIGATAVIIYKLWKLLEDDAAIEKATMDSHKLANAWLQMNDEIAKMNKQKGVGFNLTSEQATKDVEEYILALKKQGKTSEDVTEEMKKRVEGLTKLVAREYDTRSALARDNFEANKAEQRKTLEALKKALKEGAAFTVMTEKQKQDKLLAIRLDVLAKAKTLQERFEKEQADRAKAAASGEVEAGFSAALERDAQAAAADVEARVLEAQARLSEKQDAADEALYKSRQAPTRENLKVAEAAIAAMKDEQSNLDQLIGFRKRAVTELANLTKQKMDDVKASQAAGSSLQQRILGSQESNPFIVGAKSQFEGLNKAAQSALEAILSSVGRLKAELALGIITEKDFKEQLQGLEKEADQALAARKGKGGKGKVDIGTFGTFSAKEAAGRFGKSSIEVAQQQLKTLKDILKAVKKQSGSTTYGA